VLQHRARDLDLVAGELLRRLRRQVGAARHGRRQSLTDLCRQVPHQELQHGAGQRPLATAAELVELAPELGRHLRARLRRAIAPQRLDVLRPKPLLPLHVGVLTQERLAPTPARCHRCDSAHPVTDRRRCCATGASRQTPRASRRRAEHARRRNTLAT
jgi:hypothetical protein